MNTINMKPDIPKMRPGLTKAVLTVIIVIIVAALFIGPAGPWVIVPAGHRGVVLQLGAVSGTFSEGFHFRIPFVQKVVPFNVQVQKSETEAAAASKDLQTISSKIALNYHVDPEAVGEVYKGIGMTYETKVIDPAVQEAVKAITAKYTAEELITKRQQVALEI